MSSTYPLHAAFTAELEVAQPIGRALTLVIEPSGGPTTRVALPARGALELGRARGGPHSAGRVGIADTAVSARHARLEIEEGRARLIDLGSRNGTWVGGARVEAAVLTLGACAVLGRSVVALEEADAIDPAHDEPIPGAVGRSLPMRRLAATVRAYAPFSAPVLIRGESGAGKEVVARALHQLSPRRSGPFQAVNLGAVPRELAEAELFGAERGAYTGAAVSRAGLFELADGGTLLLDELGELPLDMQAKLLRVLETGEVKRLGGRTARRVDVRVLAATWAPLEERVAEGTFREDLFHRIAVLLVDVPALRDRASDVPAIAEALLVRSADFAEKRLTAAAASRLSAEAWPGNVRELRNVLFRAAALARGSTIDVPEVARALQGSGSTPPPAGGRPRRSRSGTSLDPSAALALFERHGSIAAAARAAGLSRETMRDRIHAARRLEG